jgi:hypothetical protein
MSLKEDDMSAGAGQIQVRTSGLLLPALRPEDHRLLGPAAWGWRWEPRWTADLGEAEAGSVWAADQD